MSVSIRKIEKMTQAERDRRINELHQKASSMWPKIENIIDELKLLGLRIPVKMNTHSGRS